MHQHGEHLATEIVDAAADLAGGAVDAGAVRHWRWGDSLRVAIALITLLACGIAASNGVPPWENRLFEAINSLPDWLYPPLWVVMQLGNVWVATALAAFTGLALRRPRVAITLACAPQAAWLLAKVVKAIVERARPGDLGLLVQQRGPVEDGFGFISGHTAVAFALAAAMIPHLRAWQWKVVVFILAVLVGVARIYVGVHLPLDVIGGAACGLLIGEVARLVETRQAGARAHRWVRELRRR